MKNKIIYSVIVPVFNEEEVLYEFYKRLTKTMEELKEKYESIFVNDGSKDKSLEIMEKIHSEDERIKIIDFSRNFGHQIAITAGMDYASGEAVILIDADLQDPPEIIPRFVEKWKQGFDIVYGIRKEREGEPILKKVTAALFYRILKKITSIDIPADAGDFRLIDRKTIDIFKKIREKNRFIRGLSSWVGFNQIGVTYKREKRFAGYTKYPFKKMLTFAFDAIFSFTNLPLRIATIFGFFVAGLSFSYIIYLLILNVFFNTPIQGPTSLITGVLFLGGVQLISIGIIGEYVGRISEEVKNRPLYIINKIIDKEKNN